MIFKGIGTAIITPFDKDNNINYEKLKELIDFQILNNIDAIIVCGTTGESSTLSLSEKRSLIKFTTEYVDKKVPVIAGTGSNCTKYAKELSIYAESVGVDGLLIVTPYYNKCSQEGLYAHYEEIANSVNIPIIAYNVPTRTCVNINPDTVLKLSKIPNIVGLKQANPSLEQTMEILTKVDKTFLIYAGNDDQILPILVLGGAGCISVVSNILPKQTSLIYNNFLEGKLKESAKLQLDYFKLMKNLFIDVNPIPIKECLNLLNYNVGIPRLPLTETTKENKQKLYEILQEYGLI